MGLFPPSPFFFFSDWRDILQPITSASCLLFIKLSLISSVFAGYTFHPWVLAFTWDAKWLLLGWLPLRLHRCGVHYITQNTNIFFSSVCCLSSQSFEIQIHVNHQPTSSARALSLLLLRHLLRSCHCSLCTVIKGHTVTGAQCLVLEICGFDRWASWNRAALKGNAQRCTV